MTFQHEDDLFKRDNIIVLGRPQFRGNHAVFPESSTAHGISVNLEANFLFSLNKND